MRGPREPTFAPRDAAPWREPVRGGYPDPSLMALAGAEQLRRMLAGEVPQPPLSRLTGNRLTELGDGETRFEMPLTPWLCSSQGAISIGPLALPADAALATAIQTRLPPASPYSTSELSLRLLAPVRPGGTVTAVGRIIEVRRTLALSEVTLLDDAARLVGHGSGLCIVQPGAAIAEHSAAAPEPRDPGPGDTPPGDTPPGDTGPSGRDPGATQRCAGAGLDPDGEDPDPFARPASGAILGQEVWGRISGLEVLARQIAGELGASPLERLLGLAPRVAAAGTATYALPASEWLCAPPRGRVQGGCVAMLAEAALMGAIQTRLPAGTALAPIDLKVNFVRPLAADGREALAHGRALHVGRRIGVAGCEVLDADGRLVAIGTGSAMLLPGRAASLARADGAPAEASP